MEQILLDQVLTVEKFKMDALKQSVKKTCFIVFLKEILGFSWCHCGHNLGQQLQDQNRGQIYVGATYIGCVHSCKLYQALGIIESQK